MIELEKVLSNENLKKLSSLASIIWIEHYSPILGTTKASYMTSKFQSEEAILKQIKDNNEYFIIKSSSKEIGYLAYKINGKNLFIDKIYLLKEFHGQSVGSFCMNFIEKLAEEKNCNSISLKVEQKNTNSIATFKKWGFHIIDSLTRNIGNGFTLSGHIMIKHKG